jgi:hypothetical protein
MGTPPSTLLHGQFADDLSCCRREALLVRRRSGGWMDRTGRSCGRCRSSAGPGPATACRQTILAFHRSVERNEAAAEIGAGLGQPVHGVVLTPGDLIARVNAGAIQFPASIEANYAASVFEWVRQTYDGLLNFGGATTTCEDLTGRKPLTLRRWVAKNRDAVLAAGGSTTGSTAVA